MVANLLAGIIGRLLASCLSPVAVKIMAVATLVERHVIRRALRHAPTAIAVIRHGEHTLYWRRAAVAGIVSRHGTTRWEYARAAGQLMVRHVTSRRVTKTQQCQECYVVGEQVYVVVVIGVLSWLY